MVMKMRGDKCYPGRGKWLKIPLLPENVGKSSLNYFGTLERLTPVTIFFKFNTGHKDSEFVSMANLELLPRFENPWCLVEFSHFCLL